MPAPKPSANLVLIGDDPVGTAEHAADALGFTDYARVLCGSLLGARGPMTVGVFGEWGSGKTSLMNLLRREFDDSPDDRAVTVWFNAWRYESDQHPVLPLAGTILDAILEKKGRLGTAAGALCDALRSVAFGFSLKGGVNIPLLAEAEVDISADKVIERGERLKEQRKTLGQTLLDRSLYAGAFEGLKEAASKLGNRKIVVFIDDLDRCLPGKAVPLLEAIKLLLSQNGFIFVLGLDREAIAHFISTHYKGTHGVSGDRYLDKLFQLSFWIPDYAQLIEAYASELIKAHLGADVLEEFDPLLPVIGELCKNNPRAVKRFINNVIVDQLIAARREDLANIPVVHFALARALQLHWPQVAEAIRVDEEHLCATLAGFEDPIRQLGEIAAAEDHYHREIANIILGAPQLRSVLSKPVAITWLQSSTRNSCFSLIGERAIEAEAEADESQVASEELFTGRLQRPLRARITDDGQVYNTILVGEKGKTAVKQLYPDLERDILAAGTKTKWPGDIATNAEGLIGEVLGGLGQIGANNQMVALFRSEADGQTVYVPIGLGGLEFISAADAEPEAS